ncbi:MAG: T9SS type A sorting domain-containing protein [Bacteroidetes bacterium]|nr:MAG: T9SS type A sorting domain-containing protein [Bacteroidota bacterium]
MNRTILTLVIAVVLTAPLSGQGYWSLRYGQNGTNNNVPTGIALTSSGTLYLGGGFDYAFGVRTNFFARWRQATGWDSVPGGFYGSSFPVVAMAAGDGEDVYVSGPYMGVGPLAKRGIVKWNGTKWDSVPGAYSMSAFSAPTRMQYRNGKLYVVGPFTKAGTLSVKGVAVWNGSTWDSIGSLSLANSNNSVTNRAFTVTPDGRIYSATYSVSTFDKENVAIMKWNGSTWDTVATGLTGSVAGVSGTTARAHVNDIAVHGDTLYVVGAFNRAGGKIANCIARWNGSSWDTLGAGTTTELTQVEVDSLGRVYVAGVRAPSSANSTVDAVSRWNGKTWEKLGTGITSSQYGQNPRVNDMILSGGRLLLCGDFKYPGGVGTTGAASYDIVNERWSALVGKNTHGFPDGAVFTLHERSNGDVFVGGEFNYAGATPARRLARWNGQRWDSVGTGSYKNTSTVRALASDDTVLYIGGGFSSFNGVNSMGVIKWNGSSFQSMNGPGQPGSFGSDVRAIVRYGSDIVVAGSFDAPFGVFPNQKTAYSIVRWNGTAWDSIGTGIRSGASKGTVYALAVKGNELFAAGSFTTAGTMPASAVARWDGSAWSSVGGAEFRYNKSASQAVITAMAVVGNDLYVAGKFDSIGTKAVWHIAKWNGSTWDTVSLGLKGNTSGITDMAVDKSGRLYIVGKFTSIGGNAAYKYFARWNGTTWENLGTATSSFQQDMAMARADTRGNIYVSGYFGYIDGYSSQNFAAYINDPGALESVQRVRTTAPEGFILQQNYPNPFNPSTVIRFSVPAASKVTLSVYDVVGRKVATLTEGEMEAGTYEAAFHAQGLSSGLYFCRLQAGAVDLTRKMMLLK